MAPPPAAPRVGMAQTMVLWPDSTTAPWQERRTVTA